MFTSSHNFAENKQVNYVSYKKKCVENCNNVRQIIDDIVISHLNEAFEIKIDSYKKLYNYITNELKIPLFDIRSGGVLDILMADARSDIKDLSDLSISILVHLSGIMDICKYLDNNLFVNFCLNKIFAYEYPCKYLIRLLINMAKCEKLHPLLLENQLFANIRNIVRQVNDPDYIFNVMLFVCNIFSGNNVRESFCNGGLSFFVDVINNNLCSFHHMAFDGLRYICSNSDYISSAFNALDYKMCIDFLCSKDVKLCKSVFMFIYHVWPVEISKDIDSSIIIDLFNKFDANETEILLDFLLRIIDKYDDHIETIFCSKIGEIILKMMSSGNMNTSLRATMFVLVCAVKRPSIVLPAAISNKFVNCVTNMIECGDDSMISTSIFLLTRLFSYNSPHLVEFSSNTKLIQLLEPSNFTNVNMQGKSLELLNIMRTVSK